MEEGTASFARAHCCSQPAQDLELSSQVKSMPEPLMSVWHLLPPALLRLQLSPLCWKHSTSRTAEILELYVQSATCHHLAASLVEWTPLTWLPGANMGHLHSAQSPSRVQI